MRYALQVGNIQRSQWPLRMAEHLNLYLGSGRWGACFDAFGLMNAGFRGRGEGSTCPTRLMHADHWHRGAFGKDIWLPLAQLAWETDPPGTPASYRQEQHLHDGRIVTEMAWPGLRVTLIAYSHPERRDILAVELRYEAEADNAMPALVLGPIVDVHTDHDQHLVGEAASIELSSSGWLCGLKIGTADSRLALKVISGTGSAKLEPVPDGMAVRFCGARGRHLLLIGMAGAQREGKLREELGDITVPEQYAAQAAAAWHRRWGDSFIHVPVPEYQALWARSVFYTLCSYAAEVRSPAPPMGWSGIGWGYHFPQDLSYIHPALLRLGHLDIARSWVEFYRNSLENMVDYTRRIYKAEGTMWAWEFPIGPNSRLLEEGFPNWFQFEIHNAAYPARMAWETSRHLRDRGWSQKVAWPIVRESARFFGSILKPEDGAWGIHIEPSMGQDELGGHNAKNYLCALYSAQYCLKTAITMATEIRVTEPELPRWQKILTDGMAFKRLLDPREGILMTCEGQPGATQIGKEKHPVQLNPLIFLPMGKPDEYVQNAYKRRYDLCCGVRENTYWGWTLAAYQLAASHMGDAEALLHELGQIQPGRYADSDWIQIYESSGSIHNPFYVTSHGLYLQALNDALVCDYWGEETQIGPACPPDWRDVRFQNLHTADGHIHTGSKNADGSWKVEG